MAAKYNKCYIQVKLKNSKNLMNSLISSFEILVNYALKCSVDNRLKI